MSDADREGYRDNYVRAIIAAVRHTLRNIDKPEVGLDYKPEIRQLATEIALQIAAKDIPDSEIDSFVESFIRGRQMQLGMMPTSDSEE